MRHILSNSVADLADFYDDDVELVSLQHKPADRFAGLAASMHHNRQHLETDWLQQPDDQSTTRTQLLRTLEGPVVDALSAEINEATSTLAALLGCEQFGIRVASLHRPMCPRFHVDRIPCRLLITLDGPSTEWIADPDLDRDALADRSTDAPPVRSDGRVRSLSTGSWSLLKGGLWHDNFGGVAHRSPAVAGERLLVSIDPVFG